MYNSLKVTQIEQGVFQINVTHLGLGGISHVQ